ncbi:MAG TPA: HAMP domain-containing sensor histidine kinase [Terriglobales bacterium]|nr:HAMP domain-containing sensor histidine kinase [Terriglobales bacterium]
MGVVPEKTFLPEAGSKAFDSGLCPAKPEGEDACPNPACSQELLQQYTQLRERFLRTTNALASAAHDLKTPLAILNGYVELLQSEKLGALNQRQREVLQDMNSSGQRLQQFIQDFLSFSVLETGEVKMRFETGDLNGCLSEVCRLWSHTFQEKGLALYFLPNQKLPEFPFDAAKMQRVVSNLLENAAKFTPSGGTVWLHAEPYMWDRRNVNQPGILTERRRQASALPNSVKISVADTGPGIPAEYHIEVFDDFFRLPQTERQSGMGLGLAIARRLVSSMGGKIWVESEPGAGCKFSFIVPLKPPSTGKQGNSK